MAAGGGNAEDLLSTPTWAIACTCAIFIVFSLIIERFIIHRIGRCAAKYNHAAFFEAFEKIKDELLMVGILSLALAMGQSLFAKACVPASWYTAARLCKHPFENNTITVHEVIHLEQRQLASAADSSSTCKEGHVPFMSTGSIHNLHILVFILAVVHITYTVAIVAIGTWVVGRWKAWEDAAAAGKPMAEGGVRPINEDPFIQKRAASKWLKSPLVAYVAAFFKQFYRTVSKTDYITLRNGFIKTHFAENLDFNFYKYIQRAFQDDFKHVVGISAALWFYAIIWLLVNVNGWETNVLVTLIPLLLVLVIGTKMQHILTEMANEIQDKHSIIVEMAFVTPNDKHFWFGQPRFILQCLHFIVFQNALVTAYAIWAAVTFPPHTCLYGKPISIVKRIVIGVVVQAICGWVALPVYALVSQMGSHLKKSIFSGDVNSAMSKWKGRAKISGSNHPKSVVEGDPNFVSPHPAHEVEMVVT